MLQFHPKVDEFIANPADFAKPILEYLRQIMHDTYPENSTKIILLR